MTTENEKQYEWKIIETRNEAPAIKTLVLGAAQGVARARPAFYAGQYLTVLLPHYEPVEGKAYSIASPPDNPNIEITIKDMGPFSHALHRKKQGDMLTTRAPYGFFYLEEPPEYLVCIAGGIGITPVRSIIHDTLKKNPAQPMTLFYSAATKESAIFYNEFKKLSETHTHFSVNLFLTRETERNDTAHRYRRFSSGDIVQVLPNPDRCDFFICGGIAFTKEMWGTLSAQGIAREKLYTEAFF